jgi:hypothetical protein
VHDLFSFIGGAAFTAPGQIRTFVEGDHTVVALNTAGSSLAEMQIQLGGVANLSSVDFQLQPKLPA